MAKLAISIINYKTQSLTEKCIKSVLKNPPKVSYEIYLIDNASNDGSLEYLKQTFKEVKFIESPENLGFGKGHNLVLEKVNTEYTILLNSDAEVSEGTLDKMTQFMDKNKQVGIASCKVVGFDGELQPNGGDLPFGSSLVNWLFNLEMFGIQKPAFHRMDPEYYQTIHEAGWVSGNFMILRNAAFQKSGFFDPDYFMYFEDVDLCYKVQANGFKVMINPDTKIKHLSGGSLDQPHFRQWKGEYQGLIHFYNKKFTFLSGALVSILVYISIVLRIFAFAMIGKFEYAKTYAQVLIAI